MKIIFKYIFNQIGIKVVAALLPVVCFGAGVSVANAGVAIESGVNAPGITMAETVTYTVKVSWDAGEGEYLFTWPDPPRCTILEVTGNAVSSGRKVEDGKTLAIKTFSYTLTPLKTGTAVIEPASLTYRSPDGTGSTLHTNTVPVVISAAPGEFPLRAVLYAVLGIALAAAGLFGWLRFRSLRTSPAGVNGTDTAGAAEPTPGEQARQALNKLELLLMEGERKEYCAGIVRAARTYVEKKYLVTFGNRLTAEVLAQAVNEQVPQAGVDILKLILETGDTLKYSTAEPSKEQAERLKTHMLELLKAG